MSLAIPDYALALLAPTSEPHQLEVILGDLEPPRGADGLVLEFFELLFQRLEDDFGLVLLDEAPWVTLSPWILSRCHLSSIGLLRTAREVV